MEGGELKKRLSSFIQLVATRKPWRYGSFLLMIIVPIAILWSGVILINHPYSGITWSYPSGKIDVVDPEGPAVEKTQVGDHIRAINGKPIYQARDFPGKEPGEEVSLTVKRGENLLEYTIVLMKPPLDEILTRLSTLLVAFFFWLPGAFVLMYGRSSELAKIFTLLCMGFAIVLSFGSVSARGPLWMGWVFNLLAWWIGPLVLHVNLLLGGLTDRTRGHKAVRYLYAPALGLTIIDVGRLVIGAAGLILKIKYAWLGLLLTSSAVVLVIASRNGRSREFRRRTRIVGLIALISFFPFVFLSLLPAVAFNQIILSYEVSFLALSILPAGYSYAIMRFQMVPVEQYINRAVAYSLLILGIGTFYGVIYVASPPFLFNEESKYQWAGYLVVLAMTLTAHPLYKILRKWVDQVFYGGWYDDREAVQKISQAIKQVAGDPYNIGLTLCRTLEKTMQLKYANLLLSSGQIVSGYLEDKENKKRDLSLERDIAHRIFEIFSEKQPQELGKGVENLDKLSKFELDTRHILGPDPSYWLLLGVKHEPQGLLILGARRGGGEFLPRDLEILEVVLQQAGAALENAALLREVKDQSNQVRMLHRKIITVREEERKLVAHNLHDEVIQALVGLKYSLGRFQEQMGPEASAQVKEVQNQIRDLLGNLRQIIAGLRPPALDSLGIASLIKSRVVELNGQVPFEIFLTVLDKNEGELPGTVELALYRCFQEALSNVQKHAEAERAHVILRIVPEEKVVLSVKDDGKGFDVPENLVAFTDRKHFGLNGIQEQVEIVGGKLHIKSAKGEGTVITAVIPISTD